MLSYDSSKKIFNFKNTLTLTVVILLSLMVINLIGTNVLATQGFTVSESETKIRQLEKENQILSVKIEEATTLGNLQNLAESHGYIRSKSIVFVSTPPTFALK